MVLDLLVNENFKSDPEGMDQHMASQKREKAFERSSLIRRTLRGARSMNIVSKTVTKKSKWLLYIRNSKL